MSEGAKPKQSPLSLDDIKSGVERVARVKRPSARDELEKAQEDLEAARLHNKELQAKIDATVSTTKLREGYASKVYIYLIVYSLIAGAILICSGLGFLKLADNVLVAVTGGTAVSAIGLVAQMGKGLFRSD